LWTPEFAGAICYPADSSNYYDYRNHGGVKCKPRAFGVHTPEEPWDNYESTPVYFSHELFDKNGNQYSASTKLYIDSDGDRYEMVPPGCAPVANGLLGKPLPPWADPNTSLNWQTDNAEVEGDAATIHLKCVRGEPQWTALARSIEESSRLHGWPLEDRARVFGHYEVASNRTDPGKLDLDALHRDALALRGGGQEGDDMDFLKWVCVVKAERDQKHLPFRSYRMYMGADGPYLAHDKDGAAFTAMEATGEILQQMGLTRLKAIPLAPGSPAPDAP
jgi:hypothetical protein